MLSLPEAINQRKAEMEADAKRQNVIEQDDKRNESVSRLRIAFRLSQDVLELLDVIIPEGMWYISKSVTKPNEYSIMLRSEFGSVSNTIWYDKDVGGRVVFSGYGNWQAYRVHSSTQTFRFDQFIDACIYAGVGEE